MSLTGTITTPDGVEHVDVFAQVYPLILQTVTGSEFCDIDVHCWHSQAAKEAGAQELMGFPKQVSIAGDRFNARMVAMGQDFSAVVWSADPAVAAQQAAGVIVGAIEQLAADEIEGLVKV
jgi:hypothetical protein